MLTRNRESKTGENVLEAPTVKRVLLEASRIGARLFRNNRGLFKTLDGKRKVRAGIEANGASDCVGIIPVKITQEMVGATIGAGLWVEVKRPDWKKPRDEHERKQENFINKMNELGGIAFFITDADDLEDLIMDNLAKKIFSKCVDSKNKSDYV